MNSTLHQRIASSLATMRRDAGHTQESLGEQIGIGPKQVGRIERAQAQPRPDVLESWQRVCRASICLTITLATDVKGTVP